MEIKGNNIESELKEMINNIITKGNIQLTSLYNENFSKGIIIFMNKLIDIYIITYSYKRNYIFRFINFLYKKFSKRPLDSNYKYFTKNKTRIKKIILLAYLMIYKHQLSIMNSKLIKAEEKYMRVKKLYYLLKKMSPILSKLYIDKILEIGEFEIMLKMLIIFTVNDNYKEIKENNDIKNIMYLKECLNIILMTFKKSSAKNEQKFLVDFFDYINNEICLINKTGKKINYTNKIYMLNNDCKTTKLMNFMDFMHKINNDDLTKNYYELLSNIYYFQYSYNNFIWDLYKLIEPLLKNIKVKDYQTLLKEVSFPEYQLNFLKHLISKERDYIKNNSLIFKNAFYFSGKQKNSGIVTKVRNLEEHFLLAFGFNFILTGEQKEEYIVFQFINDELKVQLKVTLDKINNNKNDDYYYYLNFTDSSMAIFSLKIKIEPNHYYSFVIDINKKSFNIYYFKENTVFEEKHKIKEIIIPNLFLTVGCNIKKKEKESKGNLISDRYNIINSYTGFIGDLFIINLNNYKEKCSLEKNILNLKGKYGQTIVKCILEQKLLDEYIISNLDETSKYINYINEDEKGKNIFKNLLREQKDFKIINNIELYVNSLNFRLVEYLDNIDYMNYDNKYHDKEKLITKIKKEQQYFNNYRTNRLDIDSNNSDKTIEIGNSLFNCNFSIVENTSSIIKFVEEDGTFYIYLIFEYYYQVLFRICKDVLSKENFVLSKEQNDIINIIEQGIENYTEFFLKKFIETNLNIKTYKITLFYYQLNVVIKQFLLLKNINNELYQLFLKFFAKYQKLIIGYIKTNFEEQKSLYSHIRNFFFEFLLNTRFYKQTEQFDLLNNLNSLIDILFETIQNDGEIKKLLNESVSEKLLNFICFLLKLKGNNENIKLKSKKEDKNLSYRTIKIKCLFLMINYINSIYDKNEQDKNEPKVNPNFLEKFYDKLLSNKNEPYIFYYLSLILFLSNIIYESLENFINKIAKLFEENYTKIDFDNKIFSISSMLLLTSYYLNFDKNDAEKFKQFKTWYSQLSQNNAYIYFEVIYKSILNGNYEIEILLENSKNFESKKLKDYSINFEKRKKKSSLTSMILNLYGIIANYVNYKNNYEKGFKTKINNAVKKDKKINKINIMNINNKDAKNMDVDNIKIDENKDKNNGENINTNFDIKEKEIEKIKEDLRKDKYFNDYYCNLDDIKNRCHIENPKSVFIKRNFSHIFYKSLFYCKAFKTIKNIYLALFPQANAVNKQLDYPSKIKNYSDSLGPKLFLRKNFNLFNTKYFYVSHDFLTKSSPKFEIEDENKKAKLQKLLESNISDINFFEHRFNIDEVLEEKDKYFDCELINQQFTYCGYMFFGNNYIYFGTKSEEHIKFLDTKFENDFNYFNSFCFKNYDYYNKTSKKKKIIVFYIDIKKIIKRRTLLMYQSLEIFCKNGKSYFFNLYKKEHCEKVFKILSVILEKLKPKDKFELISENTAKEVKKVIHESKMGLINNYTLLLKLNDLSSRTFNDLSQYPIFPWLFFNLDKINNILTFDKNIIDQFFKQGEFSVQSRKIKEKTNLSPEIEYSETFKYKKKEMSNEELSQKLQIRNFIYPVSLQTEENIQEFITKDYAPHLKHYSNPGYILFYLFRNYPFLEAMIHLQNFNKEDPNRLFTSIEDCLFMLKENSDNRESIPELFSNFDYYSNLNCSFLGIQSNKNLVDDLRTYFKSYVMDNLYPTYFKYVYIFRKLLNSYLISQYLPIWIDYIFGPKQIEKIKESYYKFNKTSYEEKLNLEMKLAKYIKKYEQDKDLIPKKEIKKKMKVKIDLINNFGAVPHRILKETIKLRISPKFKNIHDSILELNDNIFFFKYNDTILILHKSKKDNDKTKKILLWNYINNNKKILNCGFPKQLNKTKIEDSEIKIPIYKPCYSMCSFFKFDKLFILTCRYLGNIFKIQCSDYCIDVLCEDFVSCIIYKQNPKLLENLFEDIDIIYTGLKNGKLIQWHIMHVLNSERKIKVKEIKNCYFHRGEITCIEIYENQNVLITGGEDKKIFIRKIYDFELLTAIDLTYCYMNDIVSQKIDIIPTLIRVSELNCIYVLIYNKDTGKSFIRGYNLNGLFFKQSEEDYFMNICFTKNYNLFVSYYNHNKIKILNCYDLAETSSEFYLDNLVESKNENSNSKDKKGISNDLLVWNDYSFNNHEFILLFKNKIVRGNFKDKEDIKNLEFY